MSSIGTDGKWNGVWFDLNICGVNIWSGDEFAPCGVRICNYEMNILLKLRSSVSLLLPEHIATRYQASHAPPPRYEYEFKLKIKN